MTEIIIPTYNRSAELAQTLGRYISLELGYSSEIVALDWSDDKFRERNEKIARNYPAVEHLVRPGFGFIPQLPNYLEQNIGSSLVCLGTDKDVLLAEHLTSATEFINFHPYYSMLLGRYFTFLRPLDPLNQLSHQRDVITTFDINQDVMHWRIPPQIFDIAAGCSLLCSGGGRIDQLLESLKCQRKLHFESSQELIDQILLVYQGKKIISPLPMLLLDKTNMEYVYADDCQDHFNYLPREEGKLLRNVLIFIGVKVLARAATGFMDKYPLYIGTGSPSLAVQSTKRHMQRTSPSGPRTNFFYLSIFNFMCTATRLWIFLSEQLSRISSHDRLCTPLTIKHDLI